MRRVPWCDSTTAAGPPRIRVERFCGKSRYRVHVLGEFKAIKVHYRFGENTAPCGMTDGCGYCRDSQWKTRWEHVAAALLKDDKANLWVPIVAIVTEGGARKIQAAPAGPHRGRVLDVWRAQQGTAKVLHIKEVGRIDPPYPAFDLEPHLLRVWFPGDATIPAGEVPAPVQFRPEEAGPRPAVNAEIFRHSPEAAGLIHRYVAGLRGPAPAPESSLQEQLPEGYSAPVPVPQPATEPAPVPPPAAAPIAAAAPVPTDTPDVIPVPVRELAALQRGARPPKDPAAAGDVLADVLDLRKLRRKPAAELTADEAVAAGRSMAYTVAGVPAAHRNGRHPAPTANGGAR